MSEAEFRDWIAFYELSPFDDFHRFHRPAALVAQRFAGGEIKPLLDWLQPPVNLTKYSNADLNTLAAFGFKPEK
jgi:hypothetical protein